MRTLYDLNIGEDGDVKAILSIGTMRRRLFEIGLISGTNVSCILKGCGESMSAFMVRGALIAIRKEDAQNVILLE
ncbi:MAG: FeoA family protein [Clostridia bacterium]